MLNDNYKDIKDVANYTANKFVKGLAIKQPKKNYSKLPPRVEQPETKITKVAISLFSFNWKSKN